MGARVTPIDELRQRAAWDRLWGQVLLRDPEERQRDESENATDHDGNGTVVSLNAPTPLRRQDADCA